MPGGCRDLSSLPKTLSGQGQLPAPGQGEKEIIKKNFFHDLN